MLNKIDVLSFQAALNLNAFFYANFDMPVIKPIVFSKIDFLSLYTVHVIKFVNSPQGILQNVYILDKFNSRIYLNIVAYEKYSTVFYIDDPTFSSLPDNFTVFLLYGKAMPKPPLITFEIIGDGKSPNVWFVTQSPYYMKYKDGYGESFLLDGFDASDYSVMFGPFFTYKDACAQYDEIELEAYDGVGTVTIEDRKIGVVKEKFLEERITVDYSYNEIDDSKFYNNK